VILYSVIRVPYFYLPKAGHPNHLTCPQIQCMSFILFEINNSIGFIALNRPEKFNAFNREMALLMQEKLDECKQEGIRPFLFQEPAKHSARARISVN
jgi:hypothetical protein